MGDATRQANRKKKTTRLIATYALFGAAVIALSLYLVFRGRDRMQYELPELDRIDIETIDAVEIVRPETTVDLAKTDGIWRITPQMYKADSGQVEMLLRSVSSLEATDLVSVSENYSLYDLDEDSRIQITAFRDGKIVRQFDLGKRSASYNHTFVKIQGDPRIFQADGDFRRNFDKTVDALRDLQVMALDADTITKITARKPDEVIALSKNLEPAGDSDSESEDTEQIAVWRTGNGEEWDGEKIDDLLDRVSDLECMKYFGGDESELGDPILTVELEGDKQYSLTIYPYQDETGHPARSSENDYVFYLSSWNRDNIVKVFEPEEEE